jgi:mitochondrial fission protein ELM1
MNILILTDHKAGHISQSIGIAEHLGGKIYENTLPYNVKPSVIIATGTKLQKQMKDYKKKFPQAVTCHVMSKPGFLTQTFAGIDVPVVLAHDVDKLTNKARKQVIVVATAPHRVTAAKLKSAKNYWKDEFSNYPEPRLGVIVGGSNKTVDFNVSEAEQLAELVLTKAGTEGFGSVLLTTSRRTGKAETEALHQALQSGGLPFHFYDADSDAENPYFGILASSDALIVTAESFSMMSEALAAAKPVFAYGLHWRLGKFHKTWGTAASAELTPIDPKVAEVTNTAQVIADAIQSRLGK